jgi:FkbM family methyltransferase
MHSLMMRTVMRHVLPASLYHRAKAKYHSWLASTHRSRVAEHNYGGHSLKIVMANPTAEAWYDMDWKTLPEINLLEKGKLRPGARVFDLGAHHGIVALMLGNVVGTAGLVVAVEAEPLAADVARRNVTLNGMEQVRIVNAALAEASGNLPAGRPGMLPHEDRSGYWAVQGVKAITLDELSVTYGFPEVLFIDVDGFECQVFRGGSLTLQHKPDCFVEVHVGLGLEKEGGSLQEVLSFFPQDQFELFVASEEEREFVPISPDSPLFQARFFLVALSKNNFT